MRCVASTLDVLVMQLTRHLVSSDPFLQMIEHNKTYGFTIAVKELKETVPNLFRYASAYMRLNNLTSQGLWEMFVNPPDNEEESNGMSHHSWIAVSGPSR